MRTRPASRLLLIASAVTLAFGCASVQPGVEKPQKVVQVYEIDPYLGKGYEVVSRVWIDSSQSRFRVPTYPTKDEAIAAMQTEAGRLNADALISVSCVDQRGSTWFRSTEPAILCYGVAIRLRQDQGQRS